jgi:hypothetical protein
MEEAAGRGRPVTMTYYNPHTHLALARARQEDMIREARRAELARLVPRDEREGLGAWIAHLFKRNVHRPAVPAAG